MLSCLLGLLVLIGWHTHAEVLIQVSPAWVPMQYNTALGFLLSGIGIFTLSHKKWHRLALLCGILIGSIGFLTLLQYLLNIDLGIDQLFMEHYILTKTSHPGRMAPNTALTFTLFGIALSAIKLQPSPRLQSRFSGIIGTVIFAMSTTALFGYFINVETAYGWGQLTRMAVHTAAGFTALGLGLLAYTISAQKTRQTNHSRWLPFFAILPTIMLIILLWQILLTQEIFSEASSLTRQIVLILNIGLAAMLVLTIFLAQKSYGDSYRAKAANQKLEEEIAERIEIEKKLQLQHQITSHMIEGVILLSADEGMILYTNPRLEEMFGYDKDELLGKHVSILNAPGHRPPEKVSEEILEITQNKNQWRGAIDNIKKDGTLFWTSASSAIFDHHEYGEIIVSIQRDITEQKQAEEEIRQLTQELEQRIDERTAELELTNKELEAFAYSIAHDLRAPLRAISGFSQILMEEKSSQFDEETNDFLARIDESSKKMHDLIDDILSLSQLGKQALKIESHDLSILAQHVAAALTPLAATKKEVVFDLPEGTMIEGDEQMLKILLTNLFSNAIKFTAPDEAALIELGHRTENNEIVYYVKDNGIGFDMESASHIFSPFQRLHVDSQYEGTGIGLAIVSRIIERHQGRLWYESAPGAGTTFYFTVGE